MGVKVGVLYYDMLKVFNNMVLGMIFGPKKEEVTTDWRKLHNE